MDYISGLPQGIIECILCLLPIREAAWTSVLSREWRYHWTKIPELEFDIDTFQASTDGDDLSVMEKLVDQRSERKRMSGRCKMLYAVFQVLLLHRRAIRDFVLRMDVDRSCVEIDQFLHHLSLKNTVQKLTLEFYPGGHNFIPSSIFSMTRLTDLNLTGCSIDYKPLSNGLCLLTNLYLYDVCISKEKLLEFLSKSPLLKNAELYIGFDEIEYSGDSTIIDFFECLPAIEALSVYCGLVMCYDADPDRVPKERTAALVNLKYFFMEHMCFIENKRIQVLLFVIRNSPNLENLKLEILEDCCDETRVSFLLKDHSDIWLEHLKEFEVGYLTNRKEAELEFVKLVLANSPVLKKVKIFLDYNTDTPYELKILRFLLL